MGELSRFKISHFLIVLILVLGVFVRLNGLGEAPLSDTEARVALQARALAGGGAYGGSGTHAGAVALTGLVFFIFGDTDFLARLVPALAGVLLVAAPWVLRGRIGEGPALVAAAGLAIDPLLVGVSRLADGPMLAAGPLFLAISLRIANTGEGGANGRILTGVLAGLAILAGPGAWLGLLILLLVWIAGRFAGIRTETGVDRAAFGREAAAFGITAAIVGTLFMQAPEGVGALAGGLGAFLQGWISPQAVPAVRLLIGLAGYHGLVILLAGAYSWRMRASAPPAIRVLWLLAVAALTLVVLYPGRQVADLVWVVTPLWLLAGSQIAEKIAVGPVPAYRPALLAGVLVTLAASFWVNLAALFNAISIDPNLWLRVLVITGTLVLAGLAILLVGMGWDSVSARTGSMWALSVLLVFGMLHGFLGGAPSGRRDLWQPAPAAGEAARLKETIRELGGWTRGETASLDVTLTTESPAAAWALRRFPNLTYGGGFSRDSLPSIVVTEGDGGDFRFTSSYRGQGLAWRVNVRWDEMTGRDWLGWMLFKEAPAATEQIVIWARADLFLTGGELVVEDPLDTIEDGEQEEIIPIDDPEDLFPGG
ncbi:MAG TPA: hypothetical protein VMN57_06010 [Anaerolineales bacterium]|nr:hypothetical protein [Anaerolineales bacterium]